MAINKNIFKSYDIRGIYPLELDENAAFAIGTAFAKKTGAKRVVVGYDARLSSPDLLLAIAKGIAGQGGKVYNIGQTLSECLYFAVGAFDFDAGIMITASHNPKEYNGFKMILKKGANLEVLRGKDLLAEIEETEYKKESGVELEKHDIWQEYQKHMLSFADLEKIMPLKVVVDASNGVAGLAVSRLQDNLPVEIIPLNFNPDGNFPNHGPNPLEPGSADMISRAVVEKEADFGVIFDGDADRIFLIDETGKFVRADVVLLFLAKYFLQKNPGMAVAYNAICSRAVPEFIKKWGGAPVRTQVGFVNVRDGLLNNNGIMGGELSGHYCFKDNYYMDSGIVALLTLLQIFSEPSSASGQLKVSDLAKELSPYAKSSEINFKIENKDLAIEKIKEKYRDGKQDYLDGVTVEYKDWWFNARCSNTEPLLRLTIEAGTENLLREKADELKLFINALQ